MPAANSTALNAALECRVKLACPAVVFARHPHPVVAGASRTLQETGCSAVLIAIVTFLGGLR
jgi:hypothetical protein